MTVPPNLDPIANAYAAYIVAALREARPDLNLDSALTRPGVPWPTGPSRCASMNWPRHWPI